MVIDLIGLAFLAVVAVTLLWLVPRPASRTWAVGLLVVAAIWNLGTVLVRALCRRGSSQKNQDDHLWGDVL
jgi:hypothetical protein